ncbi:zinc finger protein basonuclin-1-like isoform X1 [Asterias rubens]|uniref:zinc finger protein basonuclin-1-like isoform X1 n=1 Tax=Asterias rubens TaxID=7604 RepID=UPI001455973D|nr:zinc finger protein basonuclin-1-like isoform X1 [Asterias rubens]
MATAIRCTLPNCSCECFAPGKNQLRSCEQCRHGWVAHALDKLSTSQSFPSLRAEVVHSDIVFDIASLILYGTQATPVRLRILLDRLFSVLKNEEVDRILQGLGWGHEDYARGYILQDADGKVLEQWTLSSNEEEPVILNQFLRFGETKSIAEVMLKELQMKDSQQVQKKNESDIRAFIERISGGRKPVNNSYSGNAVERLPVTPESPRTLQKSLLPVDIHGPDAERHQTTPPKPNTEHRCSGQSPTVAAHNIHLANLEQTVLNAGVIHSRVPSCSRVKTTPETSKKPLVNSVHREPSPTTSSAPPLLSCSVSMFPHSVKRQSGFSYKGLRKVALSKRRTWTPYSILPNSKQVKCNTCGKWFYDKGTWKIHFGAVHLKVKYRCTVEGCNMAFSSLRSRNRHSANPSPRIHRTVYNNRRNHINRRKIGFQDEEAQLQPETPEKAEQHCDNEDDVAMVMDSDGKTTEDGDVVMLEDQKQGTDSNTAFSDNDNSVTSLNNSSPEMIIEDDNPQDALDDSLPEFMEDLKKEDDDCPPEKSSEMEPQSFQMDVKPPDIQEQSHPTRESPTMHHFKKRKSTAPRKVFIQKQEEEADCQEDVMFKTEDMTSQENNIQQDAEEDETGIDLDDITEYETNNADQSNEHQYIPPPMFNHKGRPSPDRTSSSQPQGIDSLLREQDNLRYHVAEQMGIGLDTCFYINNEGLPSCYLCGKTFQSKQTVKVHYQNVHLKLMHACTIDGCNAMFPSRRSRDRHSTNFNLHRKLFEKGVPLKDGFDQVHPPEPTFGLAPGQGNDSEERPNHKLPDSQRNADFSEEIGTSLHPIAVTTDLNLENSNNGIQLSSTEIDLRLTGQNLHSPPNKLRYNMQDHSAPSFETAPPQRFIMQVDQNGQSPLAYNPPFNSQNVTPITPPHDRHPFKFVGSLICNICKKAYSTKDTLRTHYKNIHLREMHKCTIQGCNLMFSSVRSRNRHSQNPNLHRHCLEADGNADGADHI